jgi:hypothetical protein
MSAMMVAMIMASSQLINASGVSLGVRADAIEEASLRIGQNCASRMPFFLRCDRNSAI